MSDDGGAGWRGESPGGGENGRDLIVRQKEGRGRKRGSIASVPTRSDLVPCMVEAIVAESRRLLSLPPAEHHFYV